MKFDVCVIGGGPAGSATARQLANLGHDVCLLERSQSAKPHVGASLPPSIIPLLDYIRVLEAVEQAGFLRPQRTIVWWDNLTPEVRPMPGPPGFHIDRDTFDGLLLQHAQKSGVHVLRPCQAQRPIQRSDDTWSVPLRPRDGFPREIVARVLVDASGSGSLLRTRRHRSGPALVAIYAKWNGTLTDGIEGRVEAGHREWFWFAPLNRREAIAAVFVDPGRFRHLSSTDVCLFYERLVEDFRLFPRTANLHFEGAVRTCDASSRYADAVAGSGFVRVGDAAYSLDPLSSQGIQSAIASAVQAAVVVNTMLKHPEDADLATTFYDERQKTKFAQHTIKTALFYRDKALVRDEPFWRSRSNAPLAEPDTSRSDALSGGCKIELSFNASIKNTPAILGEFVVSTPALHHDSLDTPIAFLNGRSIVPFLLQIKGGEAAANVVQRWSDLLPTNEAWEIMQWLWSRRIIEPASLPISLRSQASV